MAGAKNESVDTIRSYFHELHGSLSGQLQDIKSRLDVLSIAGGHVPGQQQVSHTSDSGTEITPIRSDMDTKNEPSHSGSGRAAASDEIDNLRQLLSHLQNENKQLAEQNAKLNLEFTKSTSSVHTLETRASDAEALVQAYQEQNVRLRSIITKDVNNIGEIIDAEVVRPFGDIRAKVQALVHQHCSTQPIKISKSHRRLQDDSNGLYRWQSDFFAEWSPNVSEAFRQYRLRAAIFKILNKEILSYPSFGLDEKLDRYMTTFEQSALSHTQDRMDEFMEWRCRTARCAQWLKHQSSKPDYVAALILSFLQPVWATDSKQSTPPARMEASLVQICTLAFDLSIKVRQSTSEYRFEVIDTDTVYEGEETSNFIPQDTEGKRGDLVGSRVSLTLFGSLVKYPDAVARLHERHILEKAHVTCY